MPTKKVIPRWGSPSGLERERSFTDEQIEKLAVLAVADLGPPQEAAAIIERLKGPLQEAAAAIGRFQYTLDVPSPGERRASLESALIGADTLYIALTSLTPTDRRSLREQYAGGHFDDPEHLRGGQQKIKAPPLLAEDMPALDVAALNSEANAKLSADIAAVARLRENLGVALKLTEVKEGRPKERLRPFAEKKLGKIYDRFAAIRSRPSHFRKEFIQAAIGMLGLEKELPVLGG